MSKLINALLLACLLLSCQSGHTISVAVLDFKVSSAGGQFDYLAEGISEMLITDLSYQHGVKVVERERLSEILEEQGLSLAGVLDNEQAAKIGELLGAQVMILGSLSQVGEQLRLDAHLVRVGTGEAYGGAKVRGQGKAQLFDLVDELAQRIISSLLDHAPNQPPTADSPRIDVAFVLDSTGSMGDEIGVVRNKITEIVSTIKMGTPPPDVRFAIVDYKDKGDPYLVRKLDFSRDSTSILSYLQKVVASGGGDNPESVGSGLQLALEKLSWEQQAQVSKMMFLIGDAPPHPRERDLWRTMTNLAVDNHVSIFTIACSGMSQQGIDVFKEVANKTNGQFNFLTYKQTYVAADGRKRDVLLEGKDIYVAEEALDDKAWAVGGSGYASASAERSKKELAEYDLLAAEARKDADALRAETKSLEAGIASLEEDAADEETIVSKRKVLAEKKQILARKEGEVDTITAKKRTAAAPRIKREAVAAPSATPDMVASKMASRGWRQAADGKLANNLDAILTDVIKSKAQERGVAYATQDRLKRPLKVLARIRVRNRMREIWIGTTDTELAQKFAEMADSNESAWFGGQVVPAEKEEHGFYLNPATIIVEPDEDKITELIQVTLEKIAGDVAYYNRHGLMTPNRWFIEGEVIDFQKVE